MTFEKAMNDVCRELGFDPHIKEINCEKADYTYAEKITLQYNDPQFPVEISGFIHENDNKSVAQAAIGIAAKLCELAVAKMRESDENMEI